MIGVVGVRRSRDGGLRWREEYEWVQAWQGDYRLAVTRKLKGAGELLESLEGMRRGIQQSGTVAWLSRTQ